LTSANISVIGRNLFYIQRSIDNIDPEAAYTVTGMLKVWNIITCYKSYGVSLNVKF
jgi:hypothetical protein